MPFLRTATILPVLFTALMAAPAFAAPQVVASIKPVHSLVAAVMEGVGAPALIVPGAASEHGYALRPSDAARLEAADVVFWVGPQMETYLTGPLETLAVNATVVSLMAVEGLTLLPLREGGLFEAHSHDHDDHDDHDEGHDDDHGHAHDHDDHAHEDEHDDHDHDTHDHDHAHEDHAHGHGDVDAHIWLDPQNARLMVAAIADALITADPGNAETYNANGMALSQQLAALEEEINVMVAPARGKPFFVFHDAYHGFEARFDIEATGAFTVNPEVAPGARRLAEIRDVVAGTQGICLFAEPQFSPSVIQTVAEGTGARIGTLDPLGADLTEGPALYPALLRNLAASLVGCLTES